MQFCSIIRIITVLAFGQLLCHASYDSLGIQVGVYEACEKITVPQCEDAPYNITRMPNTLMHLDQSQAASAFKEWDLVINTKCSPNLKFFLCSVFTPMCTNHVDVSLMACRSVCLEVQHNCEYLLREFNLPWPDMLNCSKFVESGLCMDPKMSRHVVNKSSHPNHLTPDQGGSMDTFINEGNLAESNSCDRPLVPLIRSRSALQKSPGCALNCHTEFRFTAEDRKIVEIWIAIWAGGSVGASLLTFISIVLDRARICYPEKPLVWMSLCYGVHSAGYLIGLSLGRERVACAQTPAGCLHLVQSEPMGEWCIGVFILINYFRMAASIWWVILAVTWYMAAGMKWSTESIELKSSYFHLFAWALPAIQSIVVVILKKVDAEDVSGLCLVGNNDPYALLGAVIVPLLVSLGVGLLFIYLGSRQMTPIREQFANQAVDVQRFKRLYHQISVFSILYCIFTIGVIGCMFHDFFTRLSVWVPLLQNCDAAGLRAHGAESSTRLVVVFAIQIFMIMGVGIVIGCMFALNSKRKCLPYAPNCCGIFPHNKQSPSVAVAGAGMRCYAGGSSTTCTPHPNLPSVTYSSHMNTSSEHHPSSHPGMLLQETKPLMPRLAPQGPCNGHMAMLAKV